ncbi:hypothetical protein ACFXHA_34215 [Nocardia sp. NPDC059240]|uniref:hypothetical protein n=1 Tax=Nocardia sp. NPDC059240 TaxID=3346786 RepID=UPI0036A1A192
MASRDGNSPECTPGSGLGIGVTIPNPMQSTTLTATAITLCLDGPADKVTAGFLPRAYWEFRTGS